MLVTAFFSDNDPGCVIEDDGSIRVASTAATESLDVSLQRVQRLVFAAEPNKTCSFRVSNSSEITVTDFTLSRTSGIFECAMFWLTTHLKSHRIVAASTSEVEDDFFALNGFQVDSGDFQVVFVPMNERQPELGCDLLDCQFEAYVHRHCSGRSHFEALRRLHVRFLRLLRSRKHGRLCAADFDVSRWAGRSEPLDDDDDDDCRSFIADLLAIKQAANTALNSRPFCDVPQHWRLLYAAAGQLHARWLLARNRPFKAIYVVDMAILKGIQFDDRSLQRLASFICSQLPPPPELTIPEDSYPTPTPLATSKQIHVLDRPSIEAFIKATTADDGSRLPVIVRNLIKEFPVFDVLTFDYLNRVHGRRRAPVEFGSSYAASDYSQKIITLHEYLRDYVSGVSADVDVEVTTTTTAPRAYLAQHALIDQLDLVSLVPVPDYAYTLSDVESEAVTINAFIGPAGTISPLHLDPRPNFFCQIRGRKFVRLVHPRFADDVYLNPAGSLQSNSSAADLETPDYSLFPRLRGVPVEEAVLEAGDCLFLPAKHLHLMRSLTPSISVAIWV